jgi:hypothetical protein
MIITDAKINSTNENHSQSEFVKEGATYDNCFCPRNGNHLCICYETRLKKCKRLISFLLSQGFLAFLFF